MNHFYDYFGAYLNILVYAGFVLIILKSKEYFSSKGRALIVMFTLTFCFFSFIVQTKMPSYFFIMVPIGFVFIAIAIKEILKYLQVKRKWILGIILIPISYFALNVHDIIDIRAKDYYYRNARTHNTQIMKNFKKNNDWNGELILNVPPLEEIDFMFYNNEMSAYSNKFPDESLDSLQKENIKIIAFKSNEKFPLSKKILSYPFITFIENDFH